MPAIRSESGSVVSMPPREKRIAKRRAHAVKRGLGLPPSIAGSSPDKQTTKRAKGAPPPTLAATRERCAGANRAYLVRPDGIHIKRVVHHPAPEPAPPVPYLPGQEDIPHSDDESGDFDHAIVHAPATTEHHLLGNNLSIMDETDNLLDYDAEGSDNNNEPADTNMHMDIDDFSVDKGWDCSGAGSWDCSLSKQPVDLLANASEDDIQALFSGFDSLRFGNGPALFDHADYLSGDFGAFDPPVPHFGSGSRTSNAQEPLTVHQVDATTDNSRAPGLAEVPSPPAADSALPHLPLPPLRRIPTPAPWVMTPEVQFSDPDQPLSIVHVPCHQPTPLPSIRQATPRVSASRAGTPLGWPNSLRGSPVFACPRPPMNTSAQATQIRSEAEPLDVRRPLSPSLASPASPVDINPFLIESDSEGGDSNSDSDAPRASTPVERGDTDIWPTESSVLSPASLTQAQCRAARWLNFKTIQPSSRSVGRERIVPTLLELRVNAREHFSVIGCRTRVRDPNTPLPPGGRGPLRSSELTSEQSMAMGPMELHVYKDILCFDPWPKDRDSLLEDAKDYTANFMGIDSPEVYTRRFMETVYSKMSANRGETLAKIETMVQHELSISAVDKPEIGMYLNKHNFLYPTIDCDQNQKFRVHIIGSALLIILFECGKQVGRVFMEEFNQPDNARKCADWHRKVRDRTARGKGIPPGLIAYAATQIYWALLKLHKGGNVHFQEIQFRAVWGQYLRSLLSLNHLGTLRMDLLELVQNRYVEYWPGAGRDNDEDKDKGDEDDEDSYPAW